MLCLFAGGCAKHSELASRARDLCHTLWLDLRHEAQSYRAAVTEPRAFLRFGADELSRSYVSRALSRSLRYCAYVRGISSGDLSLRLDNASSHLLWANDAAGAAAALDELAAVVAEIDALPLSD
jgi:hypothetical protein